MNKKAKLEAAKNQLKSRAQSTGGKVRCAGKVVWKGLNSKPGRAAVYAGVMGAARLVPLAHPAAAIAVLVVTTGVQVWATGAEMS